MNIQPSVPVFTPQNLNLRSTTPRPRVQQHLFRAFHEEGKSLTEIVWHQQKLHEARRWSVAQMVEAIDVNNLSDVDKIYIWNAGRAELTTKPGADRLARLSDQECRYWRDRNPALSSVLQACGTWSRYWNEEEAHHETSFNRLSVLLNAPEITDETFIEFRMIFPDDDMLRTLTLLALSEIAAATNYASCSKLTKDPGLCALFAQVGADEIQHMEYFISFARALIDSGEYPVKNAVSVIYFFVREGGELYGSSRKTVEHRQTHVNWWDQIELTDEADRPQALARQRALIFNALRRITGYSVSSVHELETLWMELVGC
jgi:hypothetical protein